MWFYPKPNVALQCVSTDDQMIQSNVFPHYMLGDEINALHFHLSWSDNYGAVRSKHVYILEHSSSNQAYQQVQMVTSMLLQDAGDKMC